MNGSVTYDGLLLQGGINVNAGANLEELTAYENGVYNPSEGKDGFSKVTVDVPAAVLDDITITENGHYTPPIGVDGYNDIVVTVPHPAPVLDDITITENGSYQPPTGVDGYDNIMVNVLPTLDNITITENGSYQPPSDVDGYNNITVNVLPTLDNITITENGSYQPPTGVDGYDNITVNIPLPVNGIYKQALTGLPSPIATFTGADAPIDSLKASIVVVQSGSGDPSPSNIRPISGWSSCEVTRTGKNLIDDSEVLRGYYNQFGIFVSSTKSLSYEGKFKAGTYTFSTDLDNCVITRYFINDEVYEPVSESQTLTINSNVNFEFKISIRNASSTVISTTPQSMIERGEEATTYEAYSGNTYTITFKDSSDNPITVYGGVIDVTGGKLTVTHANIVSYNGESINEPWISSEDIYTQGATPTTGAQVVYPLTTPIVYDFDPLALRSNGVTNISVDCGEVTELKYYSDTP